MAQFRATIQGSRGLASRLGDKKNGMVVECNGWSLGVRVEARHQDGRDLFLVYRTSGSSGGREDELILEVKQL